MAQSKITHMITLKTGRGLDWLNITRVGSNGHRLLTVSHEKLGTVVVRLTAEEWRSLKGME
jgi:hypothetical protein